MRQRVSDWVTTAFTDQAVLTSSGSALYGTVLRSPQEFSRTWLGFAERLRASYMGGMGNSTAQFLVGSAFKLDQRHIACAEERDLDTRQACTGKNAFFHRTWHVIEDTVTARKSTFQGDGRRVPSPRLFGAAAGAYAASPWEPASENTPTAVMTRAGMSLVTPLLGSLLHEYPSILKTVTGFLHRKKNVPAMIKTLPSQQTAAEVLK